MRTGFIWDQSLVEYRFRPDHPFNPKRLELTVSLLEEMGLLGDGVQLALPRQATDEELAAVHAPEFVEAVKGASAGDMPPEEAYRWGLGTEDTPLFPRIHEITATVVGGAIRAAEMVMGGEVTRAFHIAGGLHHAHRALASGFCVYSDLAAAIAWIRKNHGARVMYIDYDAHHGDGVQSIFYDDPEVLTLSIHETGRYLFPGTGFVDELGEGEGYGYSLNLPLEAFTEDDSWIGITRNLLAEIAEIYKPDVLVVQNGCDGHTLDPLTHLRATTRLYEETVQVINEIADRHCKGRIVATGGGGYDIWRVVPRTWALVWGGLSGQEVPDEVPRAWLDHWQGESPVEIPDRIRDRPEAYPPVPRRKEIEAINGRTLGSLRRSALPLLQGWGFGF
jgi:acetoin utilization protein AcuC